MRRTGTSDGKGDRRAAADGGELSSGRARRLAATLCAALLASCAGDRAPSDDGPNVLVVVVDTLRADRLSLYGYGVDTAPFLTELAQRGVVFERAWSTSSWTAPAAASLFTSLYPDQFLGDSQGLELPNPAQTKVLENPVFEVFRIPGRLETLPEAMKALGYRTFAVTDNPNLCETEGFQSGFAHFQNYDNHGADEVNAKLAEWVEEIRSGGKWFVYLHYMDPHSPYKRHEPWFQPPAGTQPDMRRGTREDIRPWIDATYDSEISYTDQHLREAFEMLGGDESTVVIFTADHGESLLQRGNALHHGFELFSELTRIPLVVVHPGSEPARRRVSQNVSLVDVLPTLRDILGAAPSEQDVGESLVPYYSEPEELPNDRPVFAMRSRRERAGGGKLVAVIQGDEKLISATHQDLDEPIHMFFDLEEDWGELDDRAEHERERVIALRRLWEVFLASAPAYEPETAHIRLDEEQVEGLRELGYVED